jgi:hypothetical protein
MILRSARAARNVGIIAPVAEQDRHTVGGRPPPRKDPSLEAPVGSRCAGASPMKKPGRAVERPGLSQRMRADLRQS